jgi:S1-C subfamily serine protease
MSSSWRRVAMSCSTLLGACALVGCDGSNGDAGAETAQGTIASVGEQQNVGVFGRIPEIVEDLQPSVVSIAVSGLSGAGEGSGVIWSDEGVIVTNDHVVAGADDVEVVLASGERLPARVLATDPRTDLAVLEVDRDDLPAATFADELPRVGDLAVAIGNPLGFENTVTAGIVSGLHRSIPSGGTTPALVDLVQTDAPISPGNSGGALVSSEGEVIGINVAYIPPQANAVAIGFAIPAPTVRDTVTQLLEDGNAEHAYLGLRAIPVTPEFADAFGLDVESGVGVQLVEQGSPAARAGLAQGDVIVRLGDEAIDSVEDLYASLRRFDPGDRVTLEVVRDGERQSLDVILGSSAG